MRHRYILALLIVMAAGCLVLFRTGSRGHLDPLSVCSDEAKAEGNGKVSDAYSAELNCPTRTQAGGARHSLVGATARVDADARSEDNRDDNEPYAGPMLDIRMLVEASGLPASGATVLFWMDGASVASDLVGGGTKEFERDRKWASTVEAGAHGRVRVPRGGGEAFLEVQHGKLRAYLQIGWDVPSDVVLVLSDPQTLVFRVRDEQGLPVTDCSLRFGGRLGRLIGDSGQSDERGLIEVHQANSWLANQLRVEDPDSIPMATVLGDKWTTFAETVSVHLDPVPQTPVPIQVPGGVDVAVLVRCEGKQWSGIGEVHISIGEGGNREESVTQYIYGIPALFYHVPLGEAIEVGLLNASGNGEFRVRGSYQGVAIPMPIPDMSMSMRLAPYDPDLLVELEVTRVPPEGYITGCLVGSDGSGLEQVFIRAQLYAYSEKGWECHELEAQSCDPSTSIDRRGCNESGRFVLPISNLLSDRLVQASEIAISFQSPYLSKPLQSCRLRLGISWPQVLELGDVQMLHSPLLVAGRVSKVGVGPIEGVLVVASSTGADEPFPNLGRPPDPPWFIRANFATSYDGSFAIYGSYPDTTPLVIMLDGEVSLHAPLPFQQGEGGLEVLVE